MTETDWTDSFDINASIRIFRHISAGIYRNPANAIKELVINAFDAQAPRVDLTLGELGTISKLEVRDNGLGMTEDDIQFAFKHVGSSLKKLEPSTIQTKRPVVGQFGIGLLAAGHASKLIKIQSTPANKDYSLYVEIDLAPFFQYEKQIETLEEFTYGSLKYRRKERLPNQKSGTVIILEKGDGTDPTSDRFWGALNKDGIAYFKSDRTSEEHGDQNFDAFVNWLDDRNYGEIGELRGYEQFLWNLGLILPIQYALDGPVRKDYLDTLSNDDSSASLSGLLISWSKKLQDFNFHVFVDGIELKRPIVLPSNIKSEKLELRTGEWGVFPIQYQNDNLTIEGYLLFQPYNVKPMELRGIYPRVRGVGVGQYDNTLFQMVRQNPIYAYQLSGELNLENGFDDSLNLDRTGFIETDESFVTLREFLKDRIKSKSSGILTDVRRRANNRRKRIKLSKKMTSTRQLSHVAKEFYPSYEIEVKKTLETRKKTQDVGYYGILSVDHGRKKIEALEEIYQNPLIASVLLALDKTLQSLKIGETNSAKIRSAVREALESSI